MTESAFNSSSVVVVVFAAHPGCNLGLSEGVLGPGHSSFHFVQFRLMCPCQLQWKHLPSSLALLSLSSVVVFLRALTCIALSLLGFLQGC